MGKVKKVVESGESPLIEKKSKKSSLSKVKSSKNKKKKLGGLSQKANVYAANKYLDESYESVNVGSLLKNPYTCKVKIAEITSSVNALFALLKNYRRKSGAIKLFDDAQSIYMQIDLFKIPKCPARIIRMPLAYTLVNDESEICLITPDLKLQHVKEYEKNIDFYGGLLKAHGITNIKTIIPFHQLRNEYEEFELQKRFIDLYDFFLMDGAVAGYVANKFQGTFMTKNKMPTTVKLRVTNLKDHIEKALSQVQMRLHSKGDTYCIKVGNVKMSVADITANIVAIHDGLENNLPGGMKNVRSLGIKTSLSMLIPVYLDLKNQSDVQIPIVTPKKLKASVIVRDELTSRDNTEVSVLPSGKILVHDIIKNDDVVSDEEFEGEEQELKEITALLNGELEEETENIKKEENYLENLDQEHEEKFRVKKEKQMKKKAAAIEKKAQEKIMEAVASPVKKGKKKVEEKANTTEVVAKDVTTHVKKTNNKAITPEVVAKDVTTNVKKTNNKAITPEVVAKDVTTNVKKTNNKAITPEVVAKDDTTNVKKTNNKEITTEVVAKDVTTNVKKINNKEINATVVVNNNKAKTVKNTPIVETAKSPTKKRKVVETTAINNVFEPKKIKKGTINEDVPKPIAKNVVKSKDSTKKDATYVVAKKTNKVTAKSVAEPIANKSISKVAKTATVANKTQKIANTTTTAEKVILKKAKQINRTVNW